MENISIGSAPVLLVDDEDAILLLSLAVPGITAEVRKKRTPPVDKPEMMRMVK